MQNQWNHENSLNIYGSSSYSIPDKHRQENRKKYNVKKYMSKKMEDELRHIERYKDISPKSKNEKRHIPHRTTNNSNNFEGKKKERHMITVKKNPSVGYRSHHVIVSNDIDSCNTGDERPRLLLPNGCPVGKVQDLQIRNHSIDIGDCSISDNPGISHIKGIDRLVAKAMKRRNIKDFSDILKLLVHLDNSRVGFAEWMFRNTNINSDDLQYVMDNLEKFIKISFYKMDNGYDTDNLN
ncbi:hypothetical protein SNEBB_002841 [Seison nebaliae]|nr:hypothetical protein SNEBB_002841 [Seison nebaliae]